MPSIVGPYDGRKARRKRCDACVKRRIKCDGEIPCKNCIRTNRLCDGIIKPMNAGLVFVRQLSYGKTEDIATTVSEKHDALPLYQSICLKKADRYLPYFFESFLRMNIFVSRNIPISGDILAMSKSSPALRDAIDAVAALHSQRQRQLPFVENGGKMENIEALQAYTRSVHCVQDKITIGTFMNDQSALWVTFFLGLFELMRDSTGINWLSHFLHGTSTMLRLQRPETLTCSSICNSQRRSFFLATRIFEISRSLIFSSPSFLSSPEWTSALARLWEGEGAAYWHPKEALFDILPQISDLSIRTARFCEDAPQLSPQTQRSLVSSLAKEGLVLQASLQQWWNVDIATWEKASGLSKPDTELLIGYIYYHAISIYLSGTYDYHPHWTCADAPILARGTIDRHVSEILRISHELLAQGVAGFLLFFPLRVAGARALNNQSRNAILSLLHMTAKRGFVVAEAFTIDLSELWARKSMFSPVEVE